MKKRYEKPEVQVMKIKTMSMLAGSPDAYIDPTESVAAGDVESRRGRNRMWDDEDEDEDWDY